MILGCRHDIGCLNIVLNVEAPVRHFKPGEGLAGAFSVIVETDCETDGSYAALLYIILTASASDSYQMCISQNIGKHVLKWTKIYSNDTQIIYGTSKR